MAGGAVPANLAPIFRAAGAQYGIPPAVLAGLSSVESNLGQNTGPSSAGAVGIMQFLPSTARGLGVNPNDPRSAIFGTAKYLVQLGYHQNPLRALGAYNGGPGNPQLSYARQVMSEAQRLAPEFGGSASLGAPLPGIPGGTPGGVTSLPVTVQGFNQAGYDAARAKYIAGSFVSKNASPFDFGPKGANIGPNPLFGAGLLTTKAPNPANYVTQQTKYLQLAHASLQGLAGTGLNLHPALRAGTVAGGFLPKGATYIQGRKDQGRDGQTNPGGPILANGNGVVVAVKSDPNGFGPAYPIVHFTSGPYAGQTLYFGHTLAQVKPGQQVQAGQVISRTGTKGIGNATVPGWFEIGFAPGGTPGPFGQQTPF